MAFSVYSASNLLVLFNDSILRKGLRCTIPVVSTVRNILISTHIHTQCSHLCFVWVCSVSLSAETADLALGAGACGGFLGDGSLQAVG